MAFDFPPFGPGSFSVFTEGDTSLITRLDGRTACFSAKNWAAHFQTNSVTMGVRIMTPRLVPPWNRVNIFTDATARGNVSATAFGGYAMARVEARVKVLDTSMRVLAEAGPMFFGGSSIQIPWFYSLGFRFSGVASTDAAITGSISTAPLIVEVRITCSVAAFSQAVAEANIDNACVTAIHVFSS